MAATKDSGEHCSLHAKCRFLTGDCINDDFHVGTMDVHSGDDIVVMRGVIWFKSR